MGLFGADCEMCKKAINVQRKTFTKEEWLGTFTQYCKQLKN